MTENEVNLKVKRWLIDHRFRYKGVCNTAKITEIKSTAKQPNEMESKSQKTNHSRASISKKSGFGQVPVPDGTRSVLIDAQGFRDDIPDLVWVEAKGSGLNLSELLEGFIRVNYAVYEGGGRGYLATPHKEFELLLERKDFLEAVAHSVNGRGQMGLLDVEKQTEVIL